MLMRYGYGLSSLYRYGYGFDWTYILVLIGAALCMIASGLVKSTYNRYAKVATRSGITGAEAARMILQNAGIHDVTVIHISGSLTDNYNPSQKVLKLSDATYASSSVAAVGVAAHECGHAVQHQESYFPLMFRSALVPFANFGSKAGVPIIIAGVILGYFVGSGNFLVQIGICVFSVSVFFQLVTLPVEFNASKRAMSMLVDYNILQANEIKPVRKVLSAAALTYVAAAASAILTLLRLALLFGRKRD